KRLTVLKGGSDLLRAKWLIITLRPTAVQLTTGGVGSQPTDPLGFPGPGLAGEMELHFADEPWDRRASCSLTAPQRKINCPESII
ncbi:MULTISPECIES: hypothetical protein, partial [unclassified Burkholderia]|uniref:hypothetical protein n=1 Tax=unclassified Burkholderia TaxID=2613784 RepID=UPI001C8B0596